MYKCRFLMRAWVFRSPIFSIYVMVVDLPYDKVTARGGGVLRCFWKAFARSGGSGGM